MKRRVLFLCTGNSARSQLAEALSRISAGRFFDVASAGTDPQGIDWRTLDALQRFGLAIDGLRSKPLAEFNGQTFDYVITLCNKAQQECANFPTAGELINWDFADPKLKEGIAAFEVTLRELNERTKIFALVHPVRKEAHCESHPILQMLSDETRLRCLLLIEHQQELCVCELMKAIDEIQPKVSRHLAQLRRCDLLVDRRQGQWVFYRINPALA